MVYTAVLDGIQKMYAQPSSKAGSKLVNEDNNIFTLVWCFIVYKSMFTYPWILNNYENTAEDGVSKYVIKYHISGTESNLITILGKRKDGYGLEWADIL